MPRAVEHTEFIERLRRDAEEIEERVVAGFGDLSEEQLTWNPPEGGWNVVECLEHLSLTNELYSDAIERGLSAAPAGGRPDHMPAFKPGPFSARFIKMLQPGKGRYKAPRPFQPEGPAVGPEAFDRFLEVHERVKALIERMASVDLTRTKVRNPVMSLLKYRAGDAMDVVLVHAKRHVLQAEKVITHPEFPVGAGAVGRGASVSGGRTSGESGAGPEEEE